MDVSSIVHIILILLTPAFAIFWSVRILTKKDKLQAHNLIGTMLLIFTVAYFLFILYFTPLVCAATDVSYLAFALTVPVIHLLFYKHITNLDGIKLADFWMVIPNSIIIIASIILYAIIGREASDLFIKSVDLGMDINVPAQYITTSWKLLAFFTYYGFRAILLAEIIYVQIWAFIRLTDYNKRLDEYFSDTEQRGKRNNIFIYFSTLCALCAAMALLAMPFHKLGQNSLFFVAMALIISIATFCTGYSSYNINFSAEKLNELLKKNDRRNEEQHIIFPKSDDLELSERTYEQIVKGLMKLATGNEFLKPELSLIDVSEAIGTNRTYLTKVIHAYFNCSFSDYINLLRVEYAEKILQDDPSLTMQEVAMSSGFATTSSFYRNFQKFTGKSPAKWLSE